jgi:hypothetical protein
MYYPVRHTAAAPRKNKKYKFSYTTLTGNARIYLQLITGGDKHGG